MTAPFPHSCSLPSPRREIWATSCSLYLPFFYPSLYHLVFPFPKRAEWTDLNAMHRHHAPTSVFPSLWRYPRCLLCLPTMWRYCEERNVTTSTRTWGPSLLYPLISSRHTLLSSCILMFIHHAPHLVLGTSDHAPPAAVSAGALGGSCVLCVQFHSIRSSEDMGSLGL